MECYKEFKMRKDWVKCQRYKTFQPELPTKKFLFSDEMESIHNLKLLSADPNELNKGTIIKGAKEIVVDQIVEKEQQHEKVKEVRIAMTGMFRDTIRRIDLVLVVEDDINELMNNLKMDFLSYILRAGLEVEIEPGVMKIHKTLTFIKIHAPDYILEKYGKFFGTKRYFADTRYDYMNTMKYDKEWVMLVRKNYETPYGYSNYERSIIVYKILLHLSFGDNANYYGIERLLNQKVILDVFALHDGPYFITPDKPISRSNARQILNYYWSGIKNVFHQQPIHLIHEYFGPSVAFYFAFYEFFTKALIVAAFLGILHTILGTLNLTIWEKDIKKIICDESQLVCWSSTKDYKRTQRRATKEFCLSVQIHLILDHLLIPLYSVFTIVGSFIFVRLWQRREFFLKWIWEVGRIDSYYKNAVRPLFENGFGLRKDPFTGGLKNSESIIRIILRNVISKIVIILYWYAIVPMMYFNYRLYEKFSFDMEPKRHPKKYRDYIVMSMFQTFYIICMTLFEKIYHYIVYFIVKSENHSSYKKFNISMVTKKFGFKMLYQYAFIVYYAWIYGHHPRYGRSKLSNLLTPFSTYLYLIHKTYGFKRTDHVDEFSFCFPYSCIIEVATLLATLLIVTQVVYKMFDYIFFLRTDYNQMTYKDSDIPCWEREYRLSSWTEEDMVLKYVNLAAQFTLVTWFVIAFPLGPLILCIMNVWNIRHEARKLLLASRRPLLIKTPGIQITNVLYVIAFVAVITNTFNIASVTRTALRYMMYKLEKKPDELFKFVNFAYPSQFNCIAPDIIAHSTGTMKYFYDSVLQGEYFYRPEFFLLIVFKMYQCILSLFAMGFLLLILLDAIPQNQNKVKFIKAIEEKTRNQYFHYEYLMEHIL